MDQWLVDWGWTYNTRIGVAVAVVGVCALIVVALAALATLIRYGGVLNQVGRSAFFWSVAGCDVGPKRHHKSSLLYWRVGSWRVAARPDLLLKHRFLPVVGILEIKSRAKSLPSPYEFLQTQVYLQAAGQSFPWCFKRACLVYPGKSVRVRGSGKAVRFLKRVLSDVQRHLATGLSADDKKGLEMLVSRSVR
mgnify:CR=1 FL=1